MLEIHPPAGIAPKEGLRERKRRETRQRIAEVGLRLFLAKGYDGTTLDEIAAAAGISRRGFFSYFKSKDDVMVFWMESGSASLIADLLKTSPDVPPLDAVRDVMVKHIASNTTEQMTAIDNLMLSSESLLARKQATTRNRSGCSSAHCAKSGGSPSAAGRCGWSPWCPSA